MTLILNGTNGLSDVDGDASTPAVRGTDANSGIFFGADTVGVSTGGTERMRIDSSGNVGIGTSSPINAADQKSITVNATSFARSDYFIGGAHTARFTVGSSNTSCGTVTSTPLQFVTADTERMRIDSSGNFIVGDTGSVVTAGLFRVKQTDSAYTSRLQNTNADPAGLSIYYSGAVPNGTLNPFIKCEDNTSERATIRSNGGLANFSANNVNLASDERLKKDISPLTTSWDKVKSIEVVNFRYKDCNEGDPLLYGVIAQQVQTIVPELVLVTQEAKEAVEPKEAILDEDGNVVEPAVEAKEATPEYFGIREQPMYWLAIKALQETMERIETLEASNTALEARIAALETGV